MFRPGIFKKSWCYPENICYSYVDAYIHAKVHTYTHTYTHTNINPHIHTYIHTHTYFTSVLVICFQSLAYRDEEAGVLRVPPGQAVVDSEAFHQPW